MKRAPFLPSLGIYGLFLLSGASALIYQVLWSRWLSLSFGSTTASVAIVLACFMAGLAMGSALAGRRMGRIADPMRAYALMELGIGLFAVAFPYLFRGADAFFRTVVRPDSPAVYSLAVRALVAGLLLLIPTNLMGATLPLLTEHFRRHPLPARAFKVGVLYSANTLGAALGILAASFVLIEWVGVSATTSIAAFLNVAVAVLAFLLSRRPGGNAAEVPSGPGEPRTRSFQATLATATLTASGAVALASEVLWTRMLETMVGTSTYALATIVLMYLVGIALGSWLMALVVNRLRPRLSLWLAGLLLAMGAWVVIAVFLTELLADGIAGYSGQMLGMGTHLLIFAKMMLALMPLSVASGACFPLAARMIEPDAENPRGEAIARAYAWNTAGAVAGSLLGGFLIAPHFELFDAIYVLAIAYGLTALAVLAAVAWEARRADRDRALLATAGTLALAVVAFAGFKLTGETYFLRHLKQRSPNLVVPFHRPGLQGVVTVAQVQRPDGTINHRADTLLVNGIGMTIKVTDTKMMAHLPLMLHPDPVDTLVICFGMGTTYRSAISHGGKVTVVELVPEVYDAFPIFFEDAPQVRAYPRGRMVVNDGRNYLKLTRETFDVITLDPPPPIDSAGVVNLYSEEFIQLAKAHLKPGGILAHWYPLQGKAAGVDDLPSLTGLINTFTHAFPYVYIRMGYSRMGVHLLGSSAPLVSRPEEVARRCQLPAVARDLQEWNPVSSDYFLDTPRLREEPGGLPRLTDDDPWLEFYLLRTLKAGGLKRFPDRR